MLHDGFGDLLGKTYILLCKIETCLARLSRDTCCDDDQVAILNIGIVTCVNVHLTEERKAVADIKSFTLCLVLVNIDHDQLSTQLLNGHCESNRRSDCTCTDNRYLRTMFNLHFRTNSHNTSLYSLTFSKSPLLL